MLELCATSLVPVNNNYVLFCIVCASLVPFYNSYVLFCTMLKLLTLSSVHHSHDYSVSYSVGVVYLFFGSN